MSKAVACSAIVGVDPLAGLCVSAMIVKAGVDVGRDSLKELVDTSPLADSEVTTLLQDAVAGVDYYGTVAEALSEYEEVRKGPTSAIMLSSRVIGFVETGRGPVGWVRDIAFGVLGKAGIAGKIFLKNAVPIL